MMLTFLVNLGECNQLRWKSSQAFEMGILGGVGLVIFGNCRCPYGSRRHGMLAAFCPIPGIPRHGNLNFITYIAQA